jgi:hypothetical protein
MFLSVSYSRASKTAKRQVGLKASLYVVYQRMHSYMCMYLYIYIYIHNTFYLYFFFSFQCPKHRHYELYIYIYIFTCIYVFSLKYDAYLPMISSKLKNGTFLFLKLTSLEAMCYPLYIIFFFSGDVLNIKSRKCHTKHPISFFLAVSKLTSVLYYLEECVGMF